MQLPGRKSDPPPEPTSEGATTPTVTFEEPAGPNLDGYGDEPVLVGGDGGFYVAELARLLAANGLETSISRGQQGPILTDDVYQAVESFREQHDVDDELTGSRGDAIVGPATWAALRRATGEPAGTAKARQLFEQ